MAFYFSYSSFRKVKFFTKLTKLRNYTSRSTFRDVRILGIETSCDDTGVAVVDGIGNILGESLFSQNIVHLRYGGINPLIARELHRSNIEQAVSEALNKAHLGLKDINAIAVTTKPGLLISLEVGVKYAKYLSKKFNKPLIPIHHMEAHALAARMYYDIPFPFLVLLISGGHCLLAIVNDINHFFLLGEGLDNAPGEIMDKVARRMKLRNIPEYSTMAGGRAIESAAKKSKNPELFTFPIPLWKYQDCNFSFSGLKDSLERKLLQKEIEHNVIGDGIIPEVNDLCAAFQLAIAEHLALRTKRAILFSERNNFICDRHKNIVVSGGVACNDFIFKSIETIGEKMGYNVFRPPPKLCTDNGIMIAWNGVEKFRKQCDIITNLSSVIAEPKAPLGISLIQKVKGANLSVKITRLKALYNAYFCIFIYDSLQELLCSYSLHKKSMKYPIMLCHDYMQEYKSIL